MQKVEEPIKVLGVAKVPPQNAQVTKIKVAGHVAYIRENVRDGKNVLELCASDDAWLTIAPIIVVEDHLKREVHKNSEFTEEWAEGFFQDAPPATGPDGRR